MHPFILFGAVLHITAIAVIAFFVLFTASKAQGPVKTLGNVLGIWLLVLAVLVVIGAALAPMFGAQPFDFPMRDYMHHGWMQPWQHPGQPPQAVPPSVPPVQK